MYNLTEKDVIATSTTGGRITKFITAQRAFYVIATLAGVAAGIGALRAFWEEKAPRYMFTPLIALICLIAIYKFFREIKERICLKKQIRKLLKEGSFYSAKIEKITRETGATDEEPIYMVYYSLFTIDGEKTFQTPHLYNKNQRDILKRQGFINLIYDEKTNQTLYLEV